MNIQPLFYRLLFLLLCLGCFQDSLGQPSTRADSISAFIQKLNTAESEQEKMEALNGLARMREHAAPATNAVVKRLEDESKRVRNRAGVVLIFIGEPAIQPLIATLGSQNNLARGKAGGILRYFHTRRQITVIPALIDALFVDNTKITGTAARVLAEIGEDSIDPLLALLDHSFALKRQMACFVFHVMKTSDPRVLKAMEEVAANDPVEGVRDIARSVLEGK